MKNKNIRFDILLYSFLFFTYVETAFAIGVKRCFAEAETKLERLYCEILASGKIQDLPPFNEFRHNPVSTQKLLLRNPAKRLGLDLPDIPKASMSSGKPLQNFSQTTAQPANEAEDKPITSTSPSETPAPQNTLLDCHLKQDRIFCHDNRYYLVINIPVDRLPTQALSNINRLVFPELGAGQTQLQYLSNVYPLYIEKMLMIGLGDSTVSFTKFNALYQASLNQDQSFSGRFSDMYELLKNERKTLAVKHRYRNNFPESIEQCMQLNTKLIACDNIEQNWVYKKLSIDESG